MRKLSHAKEEWSKLLEQYAQSGLSKRDFCLRNNATESQLYYWINRLRPELKSNSHSNIKPAQGKSELFIPLKTSSPQNIRIKLQNGMELEFSSAPDLNWMASFIHKLGRQNVALE